MSILDTFVQEIGKEHFMGKDQCIAPKEYNLLRKVNETTQKRVESTEESERHNINKIAEKPVDQHSGKKT
jgi:hypothetical protein